MQNNLSTYQINKLVGLGIVDVVDCYREVAKEFDKSIFSFEFQIPKSFLHS